MSKLAVGLLSALLGVVAPDQVDRILVQAAADLSGKNVDAKSLAGSAAQCSEFMAKLPR